MKREFFKTMLLYILVILSLVLVADIWSGKELWSGDYSSFLYNMKKIFSKDSYEGYQEESEKDSFYSIQWIVCSYGGERSVYYLGEEKYSDTLSLMKYIRKSISKAGTVSLVEEEDYENAFKSNGVAVKFSTYISLVDYLDCDNSFFDTLLYPRASELFITVSDDSSVKYMYFYDYNSKKNYRLPIEFSTSDAIKSLSAMTNENSMSDPFSFELNFDKETDDLNRITVDSLVPVALSDKSVHILKADRMNYENNEEIYDGVFKKFNIKKNSARSYTDNENTISFIESHATLKIYDNGTYVYEAGENFEGIKLNTSDEMSGAILFMNTLYKEIVDNEAYLSLKNMKTEEDGTSVYEFLYAMEEGSLYPEEKNSIILKIKDGNVIYCKQLLLDIKNAENMKNVGSLINAYDEIYNHGLDKEKNELQITNIYPVNVYTEDNMVEQKWYIEFSDGSCVFL